MAGVGDLLAAVRTPGGSEQRLVRAGTSDGLATAEERRPVRRALPVAGTATVPVLLEQVERAALAVDDDATERRLRDADLGRTGGTTGGARHKGGAVRPRRGRRAARAAPAGADERDRQARGGGDEHCD